MDYEPQEILGLKPNFRIYHHEVSDKAVKCIDLEIKLSCV